MKKLLIITISIMIILALSSSVMAKAVPLELPLYPGSGETGLGEVILNNPSGAVNLVVQVNLKGAIDGETYTVWIQAKDEDNAWVVLSDAPYFKNVALGLGWYELGELITNEVGNGSFHINLKLEYSGKLNTIIVALDTEVYLKINYWSEEGEIEIK